MSKAGTGADHSRHDQQALHADLGAFLRGVERRGAVFAQLQCGDAIAGDLALAVALRNFRETAPHAARAQWPMQFWASLLASPRLREEAEQPHWPLTLRHLGTLDTGSRAVLLLRLVAGLNETDAAAALAIERSQYRQALHHALPHDPTGEVDASALQAMVEAIQELNGHLPAERLAHLARLREAALQGRRPELIGPWPGPEQAQTVANRRWWLWPSVGLTLALCALALGATFYWPFNATDAEGNPRIRVRPLPQAAAPASRFGGEAALLTHRDFDMLTAGSDDPVLDDLEFYAWYAAQQAAPAPLPVLWPGTEPLPPAHGESDDAP